MIDSSKYYNWKNNDIKVEMNFHYNYIRVKKLFDSSISIKVISNIDNQTETDILELQTIWMGETATFNQYNLSNDLDRIAAKNVNFGGYLNGTCEPLNYTEGVRIFLHSENFAMDGRITNVFDKVVNCNNIKVNGSFLESTDCIKYSDGSIVINFFNGKTNERTFRYS